MKSRGFTLIELLAVIVILAIIALIAVPIVLNIINNSKEQSVKISAEHYFDAVEQAVAREYLKDATINLDGTYDVIEDGKKIKLGEREINVEYDGEVVTSGTIVIGNGKITSATNLKINNYFATLELGKITLSKNPLSDDTGNEDLEPSDPGIGTTQLAAGLYDENENLITSWIDLINNGTINVSADGKTIVSGTDTSIVGKLVISDSITSIGERAFADCWGLTKVTIPGSVENINESAFAYCSSLTEVTILKGVTSIGSNSFESCRALTSVTIPDSITSIGNSAFATCPLTSIEIPNSVTSIGSSAFYGTELTSVTIPDSVITIGDYAFADCYNLTATIQGNNVTIGDCAFGNVPIVYYNGTVPSDKWFANQVLPLQ